MKLPALILALGWALLAPPAPAHEGHDHGAAPPLPAAADGSRPQRLADGSVFFPKPAQRLLGLRTQPATLAGHPRSLELAGKVIADPNAGGRVQAAQSGRVEPGPTGLPVLGQRVAKGQTLAIIRHVEDPIERARQQTQQLELLNQLDQARRRLARLEQLEGSIPARELESARLDVASLQRRQAALGASLSAAEVLRAPVAGVVSLASAVAGQVVEAREVLFEIVAPERLMVEALAYQNEPLAADATATAVLGAQSLPLSLVGAGRALREQATPLLFRFRQATPALSVGQPVRVLAPTAQKLDGVALPRDALARSGEEARVWVQSGAERFVPRRVSAQPLDGERVVVTEGLSPGERVVVIAVSSLEQAR